MKPASPVIPEREDLAAMEVRIGEGQEGVETLPALVFNSGQFHLSRWELSDEEVEQIIRTRSVYFYHFTQGGAPVPVWLSMQPPLVADEFHEGEGTQEWEM